MDYDKSKDIKDYVIKFSVINLENTIFSNSRFYSSNKYVELELRHRTITPTFIVIGVTFKWTAKQVAKYD